MHQPEDVSQFNREEKPPVCRAFQCWEEKPSKGVSIIINRSDWVTISPGRQRHAAATSRDLSHLAFASLHPTPALHPRPHTRPIQEVFCPTLNRHGSGNRQPSTFKQVHQSTSRPPPPPSCSLSICLKAAAHPSATGEISGLAVFSVGVCRFC